MLILFFLVSASNSLQWVTCEPLVSYLEKQYDYTQYITHMVNWIVIVVALFCLLPMGYMVSKNTIQTSLFYAGLFNLVGSGVRLGFWFYKDDLTFIIIG